MLTKHKPKGLRATKCFAALLGMAALLSHATLADTVYRCGEAYSSSSQCSHGTATEVKPSPVLHTTEPDKTDTATRNLRDAQALEKQRLQAEQQAAQAAPIRLSTPSAPSTNPSSSNVTQTAPISKQGKRKGKQARKPNNPYFTAVDPTAAPKKKSTAKAVPASSNP
jgi:hypothetical protein